MSEAEAPYARHRRRIVARRSQAVLQWIALNREALVDYWEFRIDTDEFLQRLKPLSPPILP